jgi:adenylate cyclase
LRTLSAGVIRADECGTLRALEEVGAELIDPTIAADNCRLINTTGDGLLLGFSSVVDPLRCATETQAAIADRDTGAAADNCFELRIGIKS